MCAFCVCVESLPVLNLEVIFILEDQRNLSQPYYSPCQAPTTNHAEYPIVGSPE